MQPAKAAHGAFLARRKLAASGSSRAPCAFPNLRCCPRCWLFSCLGVYFHLRISPKEHQKERCGHFSAAALLHYVLWCASEYSVVGRIFCYDSYDNIGTNVCQWLFAENFLLLILLLNRFHQQFKISTFDDDRINATNILIVIAFACKLHSCYALSVLSPNK